MPSAMIFAILFEYPSPLSLDIGILPGSAQTRKGSPRLRLPSALAASALTDKASPASTATLMFRLILRISFLRVIRCHTNCDPSSLAMPHST